MNHNSNQCPACARAEISREHKRTLRRLLALMKGKQAAHEAFLRTVDEWAADENSTLNPFTATATYRKADDELQRYQAAHEAEIAAAIKAILPPPAPAHLPGMIPPPGTSPERSQKTAAPPEFEEPAELERHFWHCTACDGSGYCTSGLGQWSASGCIQPISVVTPCSRCQGVGYLDFAFPAQPAQSKTGSDSEPHPCNSEKNSQ